MVSLENVHVSNIIQTEQGVFRNMYAYTHTYRDVTTINENGSHELQKREERGMQESLVGRKGKEKC